MMNEHSKSDDWFSHILEEPQSATLTVQIYGALIILDHNAVITHVSENLPEVCGVKIEQALHHALSDICKYSQWKDLLAEAKHKSTIKDDDIYASKRVILSSGVSIWMVLHARASSFVCEFLPVVHDALDDDNVLESRLKQLDDLLALQTDSIFRVAQVAISFINDTIGFDRSVLYRFEPVPGFGEIIAEQIKPELLTVLVPFLGLRFPPQELTAEMVDLYRRTKVRILAEVFDSTSLIVSKRKLHSHLSSISPLEDPASSGALNTQDLLVFAVLRGASMQQEGQLNSMNVRNCMTATLEVNNVLWGAVQCINISPRVYSWSHRLFLTRAVAMLAKFISDTLLNMEKQSQAILGRYCRHIALVDVHEVDRCFLVEPLLSSGPDLFEMVDGEIGIACCISQAIFRFGHCPTVKTINTLIEWIQTSPALAYPNYTVELQYLRSVTWPLSISDTILAALHDHTLGLRCFLWESISDNESFPHGVMEGDVWDSMMGVVSTCGNGQDVAFFFFREKLDDNAKVLHKLSSSILSNSLVSSTMTRYTSQWGRSNKLQTGRWSFRQRVVFHLLARLLHVKVQTRNPMDDLIRLKTINLCGVQMQGRLIQNSDQAQIVFRQCTRSASFTQYYVSANEEFCTIFGPYSTQFIDPTEDDSTNAINEWNEHEIDLKNWLGNAGLDLVDICIDGSNVVKQQSLWSKTKGHIKATMMCRYLCGMCDSDDSCALYCLVLRDDTMNSRVENALVYAHEHLRSSERMKQDLIGTVSHELRTPLTAVIGFLEVLRTDLNDRSCTTSETTQSMDYIESAATHLLDTVTNLLDLSRYNMTSKNRTRVDIITSVQEACRWIDTKAKTRGIKLQMEVLSSSNLVEPLVRKSSAVGSPKLRSLERVSSGFELDGEFTSRALMGLELDAKFLQEPSMTVFGDVVGLKRIFVNLLDNAIKFSPSESTITVSIRWIPSLSALNEVGFVNVVVADQGIGIATNNLANIFRPFFQVDLSSHREQGGVGLGLSIVKQLVELHQGHVSVKSELGRGTRFDITFPAYASVSPDQRNRLLNTSVASLLETDAHPLLGALTPHSLITPSIIDSDIEPYLMHQTMPLSLSTHMITPAVCSTVACIIVVDDNFVNRRLLHRMLSNCGYSNVVEAENGEEALSVVDMLTSGSLSSTAVALMFLDIQMPVLDGPSTARTLRLKGYTFPVAAFSASDWNDESGTQPPLFSAFLGKPIKKGILQSILEKFLRPL